MAGRSDKVLYMYHTNPQLASAATTVVFTLEAGDSTVACSGGYRLEDFHCVPAAATRPAEAPSARKGGRRARQSAATTNGQRSKVLRESDPD